jgi:hypothetical protein
MNRVIVCGGRNFRDRALIDETLDILTARFGGRGFMIVHGDCRGADQLTALQASRRGIPTEAHPADWTMGKMAGPIRNRKMLALGADLVVALPGGRGTENMADQAEEAGVEVMRPGMMLEEEMTLAPRAMPQLLPEIHFGDIGEEPECEIEDDPFVIDGDIEIDE